jgi:hypothetical protein
MVARLVSMLSRYGPGFDPQSGYFQGAEWRLVFLPVSVNSNVPLRLNASNIARTGLLDLTITCSEGLEPAYEKCQSRYPRSHGGHYRCHQHDTLTAFLPVFLLGDPIQSVFTHGSPWNIEASKQSNTDSFEPHQIEP